MAMSLEDWSAVREIPTKEKGNRGVFPTSKVPEGVVRYESQIERDFYLLANHDPSVKRFQHQPVSIAYTDSKEKNKTYTPDAFVEFTNGLQILFEIKDEESMAKDADKFAEQWEAAKQWGKERNTSFIVLTDTEIRTPRLLNIWFTLGSSKCKECNDSVDKLNSFLQNCGNEGKKFNDLCREFAEINTIEICKACQIICYAIYHGIVFVDTFSTQCISANTIIRSRQTASKTLFNPLWEEYGWNGSKVTKALDNDFDSQIYPLKEISVEYSEEFTEYIQKRLKIVKAWLDQPSNLRTPQWRADFCKNWKVKERTIFRWVQHYEKNGVSGLIPEYKKRGRKSQLDSQTLELLEKARNYWLKPQKTLDKTYEFLSKECKANNLEPPSKSLLRHYIYDKTSASEFAYNKKGLRYHRSHFKPSFASFKGAIMPMQVLQLDNTSFDLFAVDSDTRSTIGTQNLSAAIDCYSGMITGAYLSLDPCSSQSILDVLCQSILPKDSYVHQFETQMHWPIQGFPVLILVDNGMDFRSDNVESFCITHDIILEFAPLRNPRYKAYIENWFGILRKALENENVDGVRPLLKERLINPDLKPEIEAVLTIQEIEKWFYLWIVDKYHFSNSYKELVLAPYFQWEDAKSGQTKIILPLPREPPQDSVQRDFILLSSLNREKRQLTKDGIQFMYLFYNNPDLAQLFSLIGTTEVTLLIDRRDIRQIWVINPVDGKPISTGLASGWAAVLLDTYGDMPINESAWKKDIELLRKKSLDRIDPYTYKIILSQEKREEIVQASKKEAKRVRRLKERALENNRKKISSRLSEPAEIQENTEDNLEIEENESDEDKPIVPFPTNWKEAQKLMKMSKKVDEDKEDEEDDQ